MAERMILNADTCGKEGWWSNSNPYYNRAYIHYIEEWANLKIIETGSIKLDDIREKFGLAPAFDDVTIPYKPDEHEHDNSYVTFYTFTIDERDADNGEEYVVDVYFD